MDGRRRSVPGFLRIKIISDLCGKEHRSYTFEKQSRICIVDEGY